MPTSLPNPLVAASITAMSKLAPTRPVYRIDYRVDPYTVESFVVKAEQKKETTTDNMGRGTPVARRDQKNSVQTNIMLMRNAARGGRARVLNERESQDLERRGVAVLTAGEVDDFEEAFRKGGIWMILGLKQGLVDLDDVASNGNVLRATQILLSLRSAENLDRLGRILATDMFLGNSDRFSNDVGTRGIANASNVFFVEKGTGEFVIKGLDVFDPSRNTALLSHTVVKGCLTQDTRDARYWPGLLLRDSAQVARVADNALASLYTELSTVLRNGGIGPGIIAGYEFGPHHTQQVVAGMKAALILVKASCKERLKQMRKASVDAAGLKSRMKLMGWST